MCRCLTRLERSDPLNARPSGLANVDDGVHTHQLMQTDRQAQVRCFFLKVLNISQGRKLQQRQAANEVRVKLQCSGFRDFGKLRMAFEEADLDRSGKLSRREVLDVHLAVFVCLFIFE